MMRFLRGTVVLLVAVAQDGGRRNAIDRIPGAVIEWRGPFREYVDAVTKNWILPLPARNPAMLGMFADRDTKPYRSLLPWSGEFAGKYLTGAVQVLRLTRDPALRAHLERFVADLLAHQDGDGYLGPFPRESRLTGKAHNPGAGDTWDAWGHYHILLGLLLWHEDTGDARALEGARKIGDLLCAKFLKTGKRVVDTGSAEMNQAVVHGLALLHARTKVPAYLDLARQVVEEFAAPGAGDYLRSALAGKEFFQCPKPRWESLHPILGLAELHRITGDAGYREAFERLWWSIAKLDRHNNGGFSSGEQAQGNPYHKGAIETCCTVAWIAMGVEMLRLTGNPVVADEIELSTLNSVAGYQSRDGTWCTYNTPMEGFRRKSTDDIAFQKRPGSEEINCCSANAPRGFGMIGDWALMSDGRGPVLNAYGPCTMAAPVGGVRVTLRQETEYPRDGRIVLRVDPEKPSQFPFRLRIPHWSASTVLRVNGEAVPARAGTYAAIEREWAAGDRVELELDFSPHFWAGERECGGKVSVYRGPILLAWSRPALPAPAFSPHWKRYGDLWAAKDVGASVEGEFAGPAIRWEGYRFDDAGKGRIAIDGKEAAVVDQYGPKRGVPFSWETGGLGPGRHTIRIEVLEEKNEKSKDRFVNVTRFAVPGKPSFDARTFAPSVVREEGPLVLVEAAGADGRAVRLRDFATAGEGGAEYFTWFEVSNVTAAPFSRENPLRSSRPGAAR